MLSNRGLEDESQARRFAAPTVFRKQRNEDWKALMNHPDERIIRNIVNQAVNRLNRGDATVIADYWDEDADYVGVDGTLIKGRIQIQALLNRLVKSPMGQQSASIDQIRFVTPNLATVDGSWIVTGPEVLMAKNCHRFNGRGFELVEKKDGHCVS